MSFLGDIFNFFTGLSGILDLVDTTVHDGELLVANVAREIRLIKQFKFEPHWKARVINVPVAAHKTRDVVVDVSNSIHDAVKGMVSNLKAVRASSKAITTDPSGRKSGVEHVLGLILEVKNAVNEVDQGIKQLDNFVKALQKITEELRGLDSLFLGQGNARAFAKKDQQRPYIRLGKLHHLTGQ